MATTLMPIDAEAWCTAQVAMCKSLEFTFINTGYMNRKGPLTAAAVLAKEALVTLLFGVNKRSKNKLPHASSQLGRLQGSHETSDCCYVLVLSQLHCNQTPP